MIVALALVVAWSIISLMNRGVFNPISITLFVLAISVGLSSLQLFGLYDFDPLALAIIMGGGASIFLGALLVHVAGIGRAPTLAFNDDVEDLVRYSRLKTALAASSVIILISRRAQLQILAQGGSLADVRNAYLGYQGNDAVIDLGDRLLVGPVLTVALPVFLWSILRRKAEPQFAVLFILALSLNQLTSGGRFVFVYAGVMVLALLSQSGRLHLRTTRARLMLAALGGAVVVFTLARGNALLFEAYTYLSAPVPLLAHWVANIQSTGLRTFGAGFIYGGLTLIFRLSETIGAPVGGEISAAIALPQDYWVELLPGRQFNAFVTMFYYFFLDFGWLGIFAGGFAWGGLGQWSFGRMWRSGPRATFFGLLMLQVAVMAFVRWEFTNGSLVIALLMLPLLVRPRKTRWTVAEGRSGQRASAKTERGRAS
jgi:oligosaccharide repeat unit polymerase